MILLGRLRAALSFFLTWEGLVVPASKSSLPSPELYRGSDAEPVRAAHR